MKLKIYHREYEVEDSIDNFLSSYFNRKMKFLASDLFENGLSPLEINEAVARAMTCGKTSGLDVRRHFNLVYTPYRGSLIRDCKLTRLGYALVLLNANVRSRVVAEWQMEVLEKYFEGT